MLSFTGKESGSESKDRIGDTTHLEKKNTTSAMFKSDRTEWLRYLETTTESYESQTVSSVVWNPMMLGTVSLLITMVFFAFAIHYEWVDDIAPRTANRPKAIMKNAILHGISDRYKNKLYVYPFAFLRWAYNLTYKECLAGIPGTGTRKDGWEGPLLKTNLDAVIFLKYHTLLFKISLMVALLCSFALIPINVTAGCDPAYFGLGTCALHNNQTGFVSTTIAHIPDKIVSLIMTIAISIIGIEACFNSSDLCPDVCFVSIFVSLIVLFLLRHFLNHAFKHLKLATP